MKSLKLWQVIVLLVVVIGLAGGGYFTYRWVTGANSNTSTTSNTQLVAVQVSSVTNTVSSSGNLFYGTDKNLTFGSAGTVADVLVKEGETVKTGQTLATLDDAALIPLQKAIIQAQINLETAQTALANLKSPYTSADLTQAEANVLSAKIALTTAQDNLTNLQNPYTASQLLNAQFAVFNATKALATAQSNYDAALAQYNKNPTWPDWIYDYQLKTYQLAQAEAALADAQTNLSNMTAAPDPAQIELKTMQITIAQNNLTAAEDKLTEMKAAADPLEIQLKELDIASAQATLLKAEQTLENATIVSPIDGLVATVNINPGDSVSANTAAIEIVDPSIMKISGVLDEVDVPSVKIGQKANITLSSLSDLALQGEVVALSTAGKSQSGVVSYSVTISVTVPDNVTLLAGMSATADIVTEEASNVLVVPDAAIGGTTAKPTVQVTTNGVTETRSITIGIDDGSYTEVKAGLQNGEYVVVTLSSTSSSSSSTSTNTRGQKGFNGFPSGGGAIVFPGN